MANDNTLVYRAQTGDEGAFTDLMREYYPLVYTIVIKIVDNPHDVEEVVQDTFFNAYRGLMQLEDAANFKSWLAEIARNCARQWLRKRRVNTVSFDEVDEGVLQTQDPPDEQLTRQEQRELIRQTMETLPQKDRDIARAFYLEGASYDELTRAHGLSYNAIAFRLFRIKRQLSKQLRCFLATIFVSPGLTLKKLYTRGLTATKVGTPPKMMVGATGLIALILIGFVGIRYINTPIVEERVYLLPWEERTVRPRNNPERFPADPTQDTENWNNLPQIAATVSTAGTEPIDNFFDQPIEMDTAQFARETKFELDTMQGFTTNISAPSERADQSAEDVMYAYFEAWRNSDFKVTHSLMTEQYRREGHEDSGDESSTDMSDEASEEVIEARRLLTPMLVEALRELQRQSLLVSSEYVEDEFHFQLKTPGSELPGTTDQGMPMFTPTSYRQVKMRRENNMWRVYDTVFDLDRAMAEGPAANMRSDMERSGYDDSETSIEIRGEQYKSSDRIPDEAVEATAEGKREQLEPLPSGLIREMPSRTSAINDEYVGDEAHFRLRMPAPKIPGGRVQRIEMSVTLPPDTVIKMRKAEGVSRVGEGGMLD